MPKAGKRKAQSEAVGFGGAGLKTQSSPDGTTEQTRDAQVANTASAKMAVKASEMVVKAVWKQQAGARLAAKVWEQQRHLREYERALERGPPAAAVSKQWCTWLHKPMLHAVLTWADVHPPDGSSDWWAALETAVCGAQQADDVPGCKHTGKCFCCTYRIPNDVMGYESFVGIDTWRDNEARFRYPKSGDVYGRYE